RKIVGGHHHRQGVALQGFAGKDAHMLEIEGLHDVRRHAAMRNRDFDSRANRGRGSGDIILFIHTAIRSPWTPLPSSHRSPPSAATSRSRRAAAFPARRKTTLRSGST